ncbi:hypothetical protein [uncultured Eubacterium sp.]|mgnify:CR=1 FL=1|uniref:hypothetical protein n=1 Tax=uncultured Eubacterium sp. TaxID=165185 RepID=UPI0025E40255|nr:hypothetical protein [uncultured Eubacterium sp.]
MASTKEKMEHLIRHSKPDLQLAAACYKLIKHAPKDEQAVLLETFFVDYRFLPTMEEEIELPVEMEEREARMLLLKYGKMADKVMWKLQKHNPIETDYYKQLWEYVSESECFPNEKARIAVLYNYARDQHIPYFQVNRRESDSEELLNMAQSMGVCTIAKMRYIMNSVYLDQGNRGSLLNEMLEEFPDKKMKEAFLTCVVISYEERIMSLVEHLVNRNS